MKWNVYYHDINHKEISTFNIFDHWRFKEDIIKDLKKYKDNKEEFAKKLESNLFYYFWAKSEWEIIIAPWCGGDREKDAIKVDVHSQMMNNWEIFFDYVWNNREELLKV